MCGRTWSEAKVHYVWENLERGYSVLCGGEPGARLQCIMWRRTWSEATVHYVEENLERGYSAD